MGSLALLMVGSAAVAVVHSVLPDHWVPLAVVARTQHWSLARVGRISALAAGGHVVASLVLAGVVALIGLRFQQRIDTQQGHIVGAVLVLTGIAFFLWGLAGHGHAHPHGEKGHDHDEGPTPHDAPQAHRPHEHDPHEHDPHEHEHDAPVAENSPQEHPYDASVVADPAHEHEHAAQVAEDPNHGHEHAHEGVVHSHAHSHSVFIARQQNRLTDLSTQSTLAGRLATIAVPFGVAASPDLTILPIALAASAYGRGAVIGSLAIFSTLTIGTFVGLTVIATAAGYQVKGEWLEKHANTITSIVLVAIGVVAFLGF